jgi:uncharacterized repeat protein (TIGR01451 family)
MRIIDHLHSRRSRTAGLSAVMLVFLATMAPGQASATPAAPQLSIAVNDGRTAAAVGDTLHFTITLKNQGAAAVTGLVVSQTMPTGLNFVSADSGGVVNGKTVMWSADLKDAGVMTMHTTMSVSTTPSGILRLATVACASTSPLAPPVVCASHSDQLPAGKAAAAAGTAAAAKRVAAAAGHREAAKAPTISASTSSSSQRTWWYVGAIAAVFAVAAALVFRRRKATAH